MSVSTGSSPAALGSSAHRTRLAVLDGLLLLGFLGLVFLLGVFPLKDVDFWWHLRTGDWIRASGQVPRTDLFTYTVPERPWIDLHWVFQLLLSHGYERGGVVLLNLAKCGVTTLAILLLVTARKREWPLWVMVVAWLPALILLGGRMYVRPETLTLLYLSIFLAVLFRIGRRPGLVYVLPATQVLWVNSQGLFVFGPFLVALALLEFAVHPSRIEGDHRHWWRKVLPGAGLTGLACLVNPYGIEGALYPLTLLFGTMANPIFKNTIAELSSISKLIADTAGYPLFMLQVHLASLVLGGLSFVIPVCWLVWDRLRPGRTMEEAGAGPKPERKSKKAKKARTSKVARREESPWTLSLFRLLLFALFAGLSWQATRNSHQYAAVVGTVTAWNLGEWVAALERSRRERGQTESSGVLARSLALGIVGLAIGLVGSGTLYRWAEEGRTIGLGEEPAWFPHEAVQFAGNSGLPPRFLGVHIGHAALYIHKFGPEQKVFADPRLEVMGAEQYTRYIDISRALSGNRPEWKARLEMAERPVVVTDHLYNTPAGVTLMSDSDWKCLWFGPVGAVYAHASEAGKAGLAPVDFLRRHFGLEPMAAAHSAPEALSAAVGCRNYAVTLIQERGRADLAAPLALVGLDYGRSARSLDPDSAEPWATLCTIEATRGTALDPTVGARYREPFDPTLDLHANRVAYFARRALELDPNHPLALTTLSGLFASRGMREPALPLMERLAERPARTRSQATQRERIQAEALALKSSLGPQPLLELSNGNLVRRSIQTLLESGRPEAAARLIESQYPAEERDWPTADLLATLYLHLGRPQEAARVWATAPEAPAKGLKLARLGASHYAADDLVSAREAYQGSLQADPTLMEAAYGLALVELDAGHAEPCKEAAQRALELAPDDQTKSRVQSLLRLIDRLP